MTSDIVERQIQRFEKLRLLGPDAGGEGESAPDQSSIDAAIAFLQQWGIPASALTTLNDDGEAVLELHGAVYAEITFKPSAEITSLRKQLDEAKAEINEIAEKLKNPTAVRLNWLRGDINADFIIGDVFNRCVTLSEEYATSYEKGLLLYGAADKDSGRGRQEGHIKAGHDIAAAIRALAQKEGER